MAYNNRTIALFLITLILFQLTNPLAQATFFANTLTVNGQLCCSINGNCPGTGAVSGAVVRLDCSNLFGTTTLGQTTTNAGGSFTITSSNAAPYLVILPVILCSAIVQLPLNSTCAALNSTTGTLKSALIPAFASPFPFGTTVTTSIAGFLRLPI